MGRLIVDSSGFGEHAGENGKWCGRQFVVDNFFIGKVSGNGSTGDGRGYVFPLGDAAELGDIEGLGRHGN